MKVRSEVIGGNELKCPGSPRLFSCSADCPGVGLSACRTEEDSGAVSGASEGHLPLPVLSSASLCLDGVVWSLALQALWGAAWVC